MTLVNRRNKNGIEKRNIVDENMNINKSNQQKRETFNVQTIDWEEHSKTILNELQDTGIDIYDESRTPGMYLKTKQNKINTVNKIFKSQNSHQQNVPEDQSEKPINSLLDFFKQNK